MATADEVIVEFEARVGKYEADLKRSARTFEQTTNAQQSRMASFERRMSAGAGRIGAALAGIATFATAREFLRLVDAGKQVEAQLRLATRESGSFAQATEDVRRISASTRSGLEETAQLYSVFARDATALGISQTEAARATETLTKSFVISGATAAETAGATRQLIQGLQSGTLRGDEFNSVMEQAPRLQKLFAGALGVSKGELRSMAEEGKITAAALVDALTNTRFTEGIDAEFREMPVTFDQAMTQVHNAAIITFGAFDRGGQFSTALTNFILDGTGGFADLETAAESFGRTVSSELAGVIALAQNFVGEINAMGAALSSLSGGALNSNFLTQTVKNAMPGAFITNLVRASPAFSQARDAQDRDLRYAALEQGIRDATRGFDVMGNRIGATGLGGGASAAAKPARRARGPSADTLAARAERERLAAIRKEGQNQQDLLSLQDDILAARAALATAADDIARFEVQQLANEQAARLARLQTEQRLGELTQQEYNVRAAGLVEEMMYRRQAIENRRVEAEADAAREALRQQNDVLSLEADALAARADIADTLEQRRFLENSALAIQQEIERSLLEQAIAEGKVADAAAARAALADRQGAEFRGLERANQGALGSYLDSTSDPKALAEEAAVRELERLRDGLAEGLADQIGVKNDFVKSLFSIFLDQVIFRPLAESLRSAGGGDLLGSLFSSVAGSIFGRATGGPVRAGRPYVVGEGGKPELFVPQQNGVIVPNHRLTAPGGGNGSTQIIQVDARGAVMNDQFASMILRQAQNYAADAGTRSYAQSMKDAPAAMNRARRYGR